MRKLLDFVAAVALVALALLASLAFLKVDNAFRWVAFLPVVISTYMLAFQLIIVSLSDIHVNIVREGVVYRTFGQDLFIDWRDIDRFHCDDSGIYLVFVDAERWSRKYPESSVQKYLLIEKLHHFAMALIFPARLPQFIALLRSSTLHEAMEWNKSQVGHHLLLRRNDLGAPVEQFSDSLNLRRYRAIEGKKTFEAVMAEYVLSGLVYAVAASIISGLIAASRI